jgi:hypothetical protein
MKLSRIFNYTVKRGTGAARPQGAPQDTAVSAFLTPQSLATFPGASAAVLILWKVAGQLVPAWKESRLVPLALALLVGLLVYLISNADRALDHAPATFVQKLTTGMIALFNSLFLYAAAVGL